MKGFNKCKLFQYSILSLVFIFNACDDPDEIGVQVQPQKDKFSVNFDTTYSLGGYTVNEEPLRADELSTSLLGIHYDPVFGISKAGFFTQFRLSTGNVDFGTKDSLALDSVIFKLRYKGFYGDTSMKQTISVFELTEDMYKDSTYYTDKTFTYENVPLGSVGYVPRPSDSTMVDGKNEAPHLRIRLADSLGQKFLDASGSSDFLDNDAFLQFFKGIYIATTTTSTGDAILYFDLESSVSNMTLYYSFNGQHISFEFEINDKCARVNSFSHDYTGSEVEQQLNDSTIGLDKIYLQAMSGVKARIYFKDLVNIEQENDVAINYSELEVKIVEGSNDKYDPPSSLILMTADSTCCANKDIIAFAIYDETNENYLFNITGYTQELINGNVEDHGFYITPGGGSTVANRAILQGQNNIKIKLIYTDIK